MGGWVLVNSSADVYVKWRVVRECKSSLSLLSLVVRNYSSCAEECWWIRDRIFVVLTTEMLEVAGYALEVSVMFGVVP